MLTKQAPSLAASDETVASPTVGYIAGTSYCGSTLLSLLLNAQPCVTSVGEIVWRIPESNAGQFLCSCGKRLDHCEFWHAVFQKMSDMGFRFAPDHWDTSFNFLTGPLQKIICRSLGNNFIDNFRDALVSKIPQWKERLSEIGHRNIALIDSIASITGASIFVDASKDYARVRFLRRYCGIQPRVIHLVKDSPAFVNSCIKNGLDFGTAVSWWNRAASNLSRLQATTPPQYWLLLHYEDLSAEPQIQLKRALEFLGLADARISLDYNSSPHHVIGNRMRLNSSSEIHPDKSWQSQLSKEQVKAIIRTTSRYRKLLGYA